MFFIFQGGPAVSRFVDLLFVVFCANCDTGFDDINSMLTIPEDTHNTEVHEPSIERIDIRDETFTSQHCSQILAMSDLGGS